MSEATKTKFDANKATGELTIERVFNTPREKVWAAWTDEEVLKQWWGPRVFPTTHSDLDFREGGSWHYCMTGPDGTQAWGKMLYEEIEEPARIVYMDYFSDKDGTLNEELPVTKVTMTFEDLGDSRTKIKSYSKMKTTELEKLIEMGMKEGLIETWDRLEEYLEQ
jgi:uncharacterized protein YndB with AHSA1/START domain